MFDHLFATPSLEKILTIAFGVILTENIILVLEYKITKLWLSQICGIEMPE